MQHRYREEASPQNLLGPKYESVKDQTDDKRSHRTELIELIRPESVVCSVTPSVTRAWLHHSGQQGGEVVPSPSTLVDRVQGYHLIPSFPFTLTEVVRGKL